MPTGISDLFAVDASRHRLWESPAAGGATHSAGVRGCGCLGLYQNKPCRRAKSDRLFFPLRHGEGVLVTRTGSAQYRGSSSAGSAELTVFVEAAALPFCVVM